MKIYDLVLEEFSNLFSNCEKIFVLSLYRKMQKENVVSIREGYESLALETSVSKTTVSKALQKAEELGLLKRETFCMDKLKKTTITILKGL